jgi:uncharacterized protein
MDKQSVIRQAEEFAKDKMKGYDGGHDWLHIERVRNLAIRINSYEKTADPFLLEVAALLHDVNDSKFRKDKKNDGYCDLREFLERCGMNDNTERLVEIIKGVSFSSREKTGIITDPVLMILQDSDRLDAIGAIGIARAFNYGGYRNNPIFLPSDNSGDLPDSTVRHFYDKLLKLKSLMNTETGKRIALERHRSLEIFLQQFYREWEEDMDPV